MQTSVPLPERWDTGHSEIVAETPTSTIHRIFHPDCHAVIAKCLTTLGVKHESFGAKYLQWRQGHGVVAVIDVEEHCVLLEDAGHYSFLKHRQEVGDLATLTTLGEIVAGLLVSRPQPVPELLLLETHLDALFKRCEHDGTRDDMHLFKLGARTASELLGASTESVPLHGDLHHENLLLTDRGWLAIDPHGLFGDPAYESANLFSNPRDDLQCITDPTRVSALAKAVSVQTGLEETRLIKWGMVHACLSAAWSDMDEPANGIDRLRGNRLACANVCSAVLGLG